MGKTMNKIERTEALIQWGNALSALLEEMDANTGEEGNSLELVIRKAYNSNKWFTPGFTINALKSIASMMERESIEPWIIQYNAKLPDSFTNLNVGVIMAGNIPAVGFHDALCVLASGHTLVARCSSDDQLLIPFLLEILVAIEPRFKDQIIITERIKDIDAVIATGSNNSARYFDYYFSKYPSIVRRNRNSIAVLSGDESTEELSALGTDIFDYFGLGCRNVSKLYVPEGYILDNFFGAIEHQSEMLLQHNKYMNNYDYHRALFLLDGIDFLTNNFLIVRQNEALATPVSVIHYEYYNSMDALEAKLALQSDQIQCRVGVNGIPFGSTQNPTINDYADGIDTMQFLLNLN
jgi:hypothetical protein